MRAGQLLAEIASPEVERQLSQSRANLLQSRRRPRGAEGTSTSRITMERYKAPARKGGRHRSGRSKRRRVPPRRRPSPRPGPNIASNRANVRQLRADDVVSARARAVQRQSSAERGRRRLITAGSGPPTTPRWRPPASPARRTACSRSHKSTACACSSTSAAVCAKRASRPAGTGHGAGTRAPSRVHHRTSSALDQAHGRCSRRSTFQIRPAGSFLECSSTSRSRSHPPARGGASATAVVFDSHGTRVATIGTGSSDPFPAGHARPRLRRSIDIRPGWTAAKRSSRSRPCRSRRAGCRHSGPEARGEMTRLAVPGSSSESAHRRVHGQAQLQAAAGGWPDGFKSSPDSAQDALSVNRRVGRRTWTPARRAGLVAALS